MQKKIILGAAVFLFAVLFGFGCGGQKGSQPVEEELIGGQRDDYGCLVPAGYQWCSSTQKCQRMWEEYCEEFKDQFKDYEEGVITKESCLEAKGNWDVCSSKCELENQGKDDVVCSQVCEPLCECGGLAGFKCPAGSSCVLPENVPAAMGYCQVDFLEDNAEITNFEECAAAGNPVMESYPRQCRAGEQTFTEEI